MTTQLRVGESKDISQIADTLAMLGAAEAGMQASDQWWVCHGWEELYYHLITQMHYQEDRLEYTQNLLHPVRREMGLMETDSIRTPRAPSYSRNRARYGDKHAHCLVCGKPVKDTSGSAHWVHEHDGGGLIVTDRLAAQLDSMSDLGFQAIGSDCWKKHPELHRFEDGGQS